MDNEQQGVNIIAVIIVGALIFGAFLLIWMWRNNAPPEPKSFEGQPIDIDITTPEPPSPKTQEPELVPNPATSS